MTLHQTVEAHIIATILATPDARPKVIALGICDWPVAVYDAFMDQHPSRETHLAPENAGVALDGRALSACGVPMDAHLVAPAGTTPTCIACAIATGVDPNHFLPASAGTAA